MLGKAPYLTLNQFVNALRGFDIREEEDEVPQENHSMAFSAQRGRVRGSRGNYNQNRGNSNYNSRGRGCRLVGQGQNHRTVYGSNQMKRMDSSSAWQICGRNNHTALKCFYRWDYSYQAIEDLPRALAATNLQGITNDPTMYV